MVMMGKMMSPPYLPVDRSKVWTGIEVQVKQENTCDFEEEEKEEDVFNYF